MHLGGVSSNPDWNSVVCDGFWKQIFESENDVESFISSCNAKSLEGAEVAGNFWELYKANDYKPIEFQDQGNVQEKIDGNLKEEIAKLTRLKAIEAEIANVPESKDGLEAEVVEKHLQTLSDSLKSLESIKLYIRLNGKIREEIAQKKAALV